MRSLSLTTVVLFFSVCCLVQGVAKIEATKNIENQQTSGEIRSFGQVGPQLMDRE
jgi:hypothetical protein